MATHPHPHGRHAELQLLGVSFRTAPLAVREALALDPGAVRRALESARSILPEGEALLLSTCNRTELYAVGAASDVLRAWHRGVLGEANADEACPALAGARYQREGSAAAEHLFRVAAGLESAVLGDNEIVGQLRSAAALADELGLLGPRLRVAVDQSLRTSKVARAQTSIGAGGAGIGSAVASLVAARSGPGCRVVLVGAGDAAAVIARELRKRVSADLVVVNRSPERAAALALQHGGTAAGLDRLESVLLDADAVVLATGAPSPILTPGTVARAAAQRPGWSPLVIDAGLPRNADPRCPIEVVTMDSLADRTRRLAQVRTAAVADVERCIEAGLVRWRSTELRRRVPRDHRTSASLSAPISRAS